MERIMNEENDLGHDMEGDAVKSAVVCVCGDQMVQALNEVETEKPFRCIIGIDCC